MSETIHGRLLGVTFQKTEETSLTLKNLSKEQTSTLHITESFIPAAGSSARTKKHFPGRKSWKVSSSTLFSQEDFYRLSSAMKDSIILRITFGHKYDGIVYEGNAFPTRIRVTGNIRELVKCQIEWQGTGPLNKAPE